jgi:large subunit ribosomal protein L23
MTIINKNMGFLDKLIGKKEEEKKPEVKKEKAGTVRAEKKAEAKKEKVAKTEKVAKPEKPKKGVKARKVAKKNENIAHKILLENLISEKSTQLAADNKHVFKVANNASKFQIKEAVEGYHGVQVISVNTIKIRPKKRIHGRTIGWKKGYKKAVVTLAEGDTITAVEGV